MLALSEFLVERFQLVTVEEASAEGDLGTLAALQRAAAPDRPGGR